MDRRMFFGALACSLVAPPVVAQAQQAGKVYKIGVLANEPSPMWKAFRQRLKELGSTPSRPGTPGPLRPGPGRTSQLGGCVFLPGAIEISRLRQIQALDRLPDGRAILRRFMVGGHWRRASPGWVDQRMRWIEPY